MRQRRGLGFRVAGNIDLSLSCCHHSLVFISCFFSVKRLVDGTFFVNSFSRTTAGVEGWRPPGQWTLTGACVCLLSPQGSLIFVVGKNEGLLMVSGRRHNSDDLVATALAVEPVKTVFRGRYY